MTERMLLSWLPLGYLRCPSGIIVITSVWADLYAASARPGLDDSAIARPSRTVNSSPCTNPGHSGQEIAAMKRCSGNTNGKKPKRNHSFGDTRELCCSHHLRGNMAARMLIKPTHFTGLYPPKLQVIGITSPLCASRAAFARSRRSRICCLASPAASRASARANRLLQGL